MDPIADLARPTTVATDWKGALVLLGLGTPKNRAIAAAVAFGGVAYLAGLPKGLWREDGTMRPHALLSADEDAVNVHFSMVPLAVGALVYLFV